MNCTENPKPENTAIEVKEPVAAYYTGGVGKAIADNVWDEDDTDDDGIDWDAIGAPESITVNSYEELCRMLAEGRADIEAGRVVSLDDAVDEILRDIENGTI